MISPANVSCALFNQTQTVHVPPGPDSVVGNVTAPAADLPIPADPLTVDPAPNLTLLHRFPAVAVVTVNTEQDVVFQLPAGAAVSVRASLLYCVATAGPPCNNCGATVGAPIPVALLQGAVLELYECQVSVIVTRMPCPHHTPADPGSYALMLPFAALTPWKTSLASTGYLIDGAGVTFISGNTPRSQLFDIPLFHWLSDVQLEISAVLGGALCRDSF